MEANRGEDKHPEKAIKLSICTEGSRKNLWGKGNPFNTYLNEDKIYTLNSLND